MTNSADYYPFGGQIKALSYQKPSSVNNAYGYQGLYAESDDNTGWHGFELRQYDAFLGRWMSMDPYGQYASPYVGMGNSPVNGVDPDGGLNWWVFGGALAGGIIGGLAADKNIEDQVGGALAGMASGAIFGGLIGGFGSGLAENLPDLGKILLDAGEVISDVGEVGELYASARNGAAFLESIGESNNIASSVSPTPGRNIFPRRSDYPEGSFGDFLFKLDLALFQSSFFPTLGGGFSKARSATKAGSKMFEQGWKGIKSFFTGKDAVKTTAKLWKLTKDGASQIKNHKTFGTIYKSKSDKLWWAVDKAGHGGSKFKVFKETKKGLEWFKDADEFGDFISNKHKGATGTFIPWEQLKTVK